MALVLVLAPVPAAADAASPPSAKSKASLQRALGSIMRQTGRYSGAYVIDAGSGKRLFAFRSKTLRILASNTKIFTTSATLDRYGPASTLATTLAGKGKLTASGTWHGDLYLRGGGDPTFGSRSFARSTYGSDASVEAIADRLASAGFKSVTGAIRGDESIFDSMRGGPSSDGGISPYVGPLSGLDYNRGLTSGGSNYITNPALYSAQRLDDALGARGIDVHGSPGTGAVPSGSVRVAEVRSPSVGRLIRLTMKPSDNFFAEMLAKGLPVDARSGGSLRAAGAPEPHTPTPSDPSAGAMPPLPDVVGTTSDGARAARSYAHRLGTKPKLVDGSGLSRSDRATPRDVAYQLYRLRKQPAFSRFQGSLPIAGRDGTLADRMRSGWAHKRCRAKTGTLSNVSALSGYCKTRSGRTLVFSVLSNYIYTPTAKSLEDRAAQTLAAFTG